MSIKKRGSSGGISVKNYPAKLAQQKQPMFFLSKFRIANWSDPQSALIVLLCLWLTYAFIGPGSSTAADPNVITRMGLVYSILNNHTLTIDQFADLTTDKAELGEHYYSDKAPGISMMALPVAGIALAGMRAASIDTRPFVGRKFKTSYYLTVWLVCLFTSSLFTALAGMAIFCLARHYGAGKGAALFGAFAFGLATPSAGWATTLFGHALAGACLFIPFVLIILTSDAKSDRRLDLIAGPLIGALLSWSVVVEFTGAVAALALSGFAIYRLFKMQSTRSIRLATGGVVGGVIAAMPLALYNMTAFGSVFHLGYEHVVGFQGMKHGFLGIGVPKPEVLWAIIFGQYRGILWISPLLIFAPLGYLRSFRELPSDVAIILLLIPVSYLAINSGYFYWDGGWSTGPRHITPSLAFVTFTFVALWQSASRPLRWGLGFASALSSALTLVCASTTMNAPTTFKQPLFQVIIPDLLEGRVHNALVYFNRLIHFSAPSLLTFLAFPVIWASVVLFVSTILPQDLPCPCRLQTYEKRINPPKNAR